MGKCSRCGKNTGFLGGSYCQDEEDYQFGDILEVVGGFYKGQKGKLLAEYDCGWKSTADYEIQLENGKIIDGLDEKEVRKISSSTEK